MESLGFGMEFDPNTILNNLTSVGTASSSSGTSSGSLISPPSRSHCLPISMASNRSCGLLISSWSSTFSLGLPLWPRPLPTCLFIFLALVGKQQLYGSHTKNWWQYWLEDQNQQEKKAFHRCWIWNAPPLMSNADNLLYNLLTPCFFLTNMQICQKINNTEILHRHGPVLLPHKTHMSFQFLT